MYQLNFSHLRYFWAVAHEGNLTRTAERLNITQSAVSVQIRKLEERLGHQLFDRRGRELHITEAGRVVLDHADQIFAVGEELIGTLRGVGQTRLALRVGALATLSRNFQIDFLQPVLGRADVEVVLLSGSAEELMRALSGHSLDVVLSNHAPSSDALTPFVAHRVAEQQVSLVGTPARLRQTHNDIESLLRAHPVILPTMNSTIRTGFDALVGQLGIRPQLAAEVDDMAMMRLLAREDVGLAVLPPIVVKDELASGLLTDAHDLPEIAETFYAITTRRRFPNPLMKELLR
ncbi:MAG: LysR family transcriptional regulator [Woeseiaceae bacterium]|jgi:LysR family transcriptional activator of nhaA